MSNVANAMIDVLAEAGVRHVFGVPSGPWAPFMDAMRTGPVEFVLTSTEAAAGFMADVCSRVTGKPGACYGTFGPGATNLCTGSAPPGSTARRCWRSPPKGRKACGTGRFRCRSITRPCSRP